MEADEVLKLFDSRWFHHGFLSNLPAPATAKYVPQIKHKTEDSKLSGEPNLLSTSNRCLGGFNATAEAVEIQEEMEKSREKKSSPRNRRKKAIRKDGMISRSLSALEFQEVKGFIDLGFVFTEEDKKSNLVSIIPGLEKWGSDGKVVKEKLDQVSRPYLSEAWQVSLMNSRIPLVNNEINMKDHLRIWAHNVASTVR